MNNTANQFDGNARTQHTTFRMETAVGIEINAPAERIWALLTDVAGFPAWNSTVTTMEGEIVEGGHVKLTVPIAEGRIFKLKVSDMVANQSMVWSDGFAPMFRGRRTFTLTKAGATTRFEMVEVMTGLMLPMIAKHLPDFGPAFATYAADLKRTAEAA